MLASTIPARLFDQAKQQPAGPAYYAKKLGNYVPTSWSEYARLVMRAAKSLLALGAEPGFTVSILGFNRPEWIVMDMAAMAAGGAPAGIYTTCSPSEVRYIIHHAESQVVLVENAAQWEKVKQERANLPLLKHVVLMEGTKIDDPMCLTWAEFLAKGDDVSDQRVLERMHALKPGALATLIYTSGTTGPPKGVMLSHENIAWTAEAALKMTGITSSDRAISYLPLSHIAEQMFSIHGHVTAGIRLYFAESLDKLAENLKEVRPTLIFGVPRIWEKFHTGLSGKLAEAKGAKAKLVDWARSVGTEASAYYARGESMPPVLSLKYKVANKLVFSKVKAALGLDAARMSVSGAAPVAKEVLEFMATLDIVVNEVYGQSEDTGPTTFNMRGKVRFGTVGQAIPGVEVKIAEDGEICVKGKNVFLGYYKEPEATAETLIDGWLHSGDLGAFDKDGFLTITGRKKEIIITAGGKNIAPKNIEAALKNHPLIGEAVVIGDRRKFLSALITIDPDAAVKFAAEHNIQDVKNLHHSAVVRDVVQKCLDEVNREFARVEQVKKFTVLPRAFSMDTGELTPTLKVKRKVVNDVWSKEIEAMYEGA